MRLNFTLFSLLVSAVSLTNPATIRASISPDFTEGPVEQAIGFYSSGSLIQAMNIPDTGDGFLKLFLSRDRGWSTFDLQAVIAKSAHDLKNAYPNGERLQIGDMSARKGGFVGRHSSHQNGLDADIAYYRVNKKEQAVEHNGFAEVFVKNGKITNNFDLERNWELIRSLVATNRVPRIFVDAAIKKAFCDYTVALGTRKSEIETLRVLRPWPNHADHLHLRLTCPKNSPRCTPQPEPEPGDGCLELETATWTSPYWTYSPFANEPGYDD